MPCSGPERLLRCYLSNTDVFYLFRADIGKMCGLLLPSSPDWGLSSGEPQPSTRRQASSDLEEWVLLVSARGARVPCPCQEPLHPGGQGRALSLHWTHLCVRFCVFSPGVQCMLSGLQKKIINQHKYSQMFMLACWMDRHCQKDPLQSRTTQLNWKINWRIFNPLDQGSPDSGPPVVMELQSP